MHAVTLDVVAAVVVLDAWRHWSLHTRTRPVSVVLRLDTKIQQLYLSYIQQRKHLKHRQSAERTDCGKLLHAFGQGVLDRWSALLTV